MEWYIILALAVMMPVLLVPLVFIWYAAIKDVLTK